MSSATTPVGDALLHHPVIYEINTWVWLTELRHRHGRAMTLETVPSDEWDAIAAWGVDAVWLMGVWERSREGIRIALENVDLVAEFERVLPDFTPADVVGSPYCVRRYEVDPWLGGRAGLASARAALTDRGIGLILDFVPNHVAPDHPWVAEHPSYFVRGDAADLARAPTAFFQAGDVVLARGRDPYFPPWPDVVQINAFDAGLRRAIVDTLADIAGQCDGVRCDMAMLFLTDIFAQTWGERAGDLPATEYWQDVIRAVKSIHPSFVFLAEAYWDKEWSLQQLGFDYCYDKRLYDRLVHDSAGSVRGHLQADPEYQHRLVRFIENHDEPRAAAAFPAEKERAAAVTAATQMGARLFHDGQFEGRRVKLPVFLARRPPEPPDAGLTEFYRRLLSALRLAPVRAGEWRSCACSGWPDNASFENLVAWSWRLDGSWVLVVVNLSGSPAQGRVHPPWSDLGGRSWRLVDMLSGDEYHRDGSEMQTTGMFVDLPAWGAHLFTA